MGTSTTQFPAKRNHSRHALAGISIAKQATKPTETPQGSAFTRAVNAILIAPARWALCVSIFGGAMFALFGYVQRICFPQCVVVVQQFEVSPEVAKRLSMSARTASDIFIDSLNQHAAFGSQFHGADYYQYDAAGTQSIALQQSIRVPVQSSYDFEVKGISVAKVMRLYSWIRNKQWSISGDMLTVGSQTVVRVRMNGDGVAKYWEVTDSRGSDGVSLIRRATDAMLAEQNPEMLGRSFLQQHQYSRAIDIFRSWTLQEPRNWKPSYYLSLAYDYQGGMREALCLAHWSANIARQEKMVAALEAKKAASSSTGSPAQLAEVIQAVFQMNAVPTTPPRSDPEARERLSELKVAERSLNDLASKNLSNLNYSIQLARTLDREAALEADPLAHLDYAFTDEKRAIDLLEKAIQQAPGNGGLYEQRSIFLQRQVKIAERQKLSSDLIAKMEIEETDGFRRALELSPKNNSPLWGAVYGLLDRRENDVAVEVAHTIMLLEPESTTAEVAYTVALAQVGDKDEAKRYLPPLLDKASQTELEALWHSFETSGDFEVRGQIADAAKKRFNQDLTVQPATPI